MATTYTTDSGFIIKEMTDREQKEFLAEMDAYDKMVSSPDYIRHTNDRYELPYQLLNEVEIAFEKYELTVKANGKTKKFKASLTKLNDKTNLEVRKLYGIQ